MNCSVALIGGQTSDKKEILKSMGFRWHSSRRNWFKYGEPDQYRILKKQCHYLWRSYPGEILFRVFVVTPKEVNDNGIPF